MATKILEWMKSNKVLLTVLGNVGILYGVTVAPGTISLTTYRQYYQLRIKQPTSDTPTVCYPDERLRSCIHEVKMDFQEWKAKQNSEVKEDLEEETILKDRIKFMIIPGFHPCHKGSIDSKFGCLISIPHYFMNCIPEHVDNVRSLSKGRLLTVLSKGQIERTPRVPVDVNSEEGIALKKSLILTDEERKFVLMRELLSCQNNPDNMIAALRIVTATTFLGLTYYARELMIQNVGMRFSALAKTDLHEISKIFARGPLYVFILGTGLVTYFSLLFLYKNRLEKQSDRTVASMDKSYAEAGRDYYQRIIARNQVCRNILGTKDGDYLFTAKGDTRPWFFSQETPVTERLVIMESYLSKYAEGNDKSQVRSEDQTAVN
ncbi:transmembrane protein 177-like [Pecten maximus]|uniref:transmembrane protein 177-like n=1 Tax=Pecten maximus TaxID=6579 RepID=UPI001458B800|nr:transmembrane protein 177-like [Pecten maximus]